MLLITHDLGVVAGFCDTVQVMYAGMIVESGTAGDLFHNPQHPYTWGLLGSMTRMDEAQQHRLVLGARRPAVADRHAKGCRFAARCDFEIDLCRESLPILRVNEGRHPRPWHVTGPPNSISSSRFPRRCSSDGRRRPASPIPPLPPMQPGT